MSRDFPLPRPDVLLEPIPRDIERAAHERVRVVGMRSIADDDVFIRNSEANPDVEGPPLEAVAVRSVDPHLAAPDLVGEWRETRKTLRHFLREAGRVGDLTHPNLQRHSHEKSLPGMPEPAMMRLNQFSPATSPLGSCSMNVPAPARLDRFLPRPDVRERHEIRVHAPPALVLDTARQLDPESIPAVRAIFAARAWVLGSRRPRPAPAGLVEMTRRLGWGVLDEEEGRYFCAGAVCRPWLADVDFRPLPPADFAAYADPGCVKIAWTLEADPAQSGWTRFATETRAVATDEPSRKKFRRYWRIASPGILLIRKLLMPAIRREAERRSRAAHPSI